MQLIDEMAAAAGPGGQHERTLLLVWGDHGQTDQGDHGGGTPAEVGRCRMQSYPYMQWPFAVRFSMARPGPACLHGDPLPDPQHARQLTCTQGLH